jgi:hypothetical protein
LSAESGTRVRPSTESNLVEWLGCVALEMIENAAVKTPDGERSCPDLVVAVGQHGDIILEVSERGVE